MVEIPPSEVEDDSKRIVTDGIFEREFTVDREVAGEFLIQIGEQLKADTTITVSGDDWEIPFDFREPVELEVEFEGAGERELELEVELHGADGDDAPTIS
ncbi:MAG: amphi-Trp domain-containing protein [Halosimplex sp.]